MIVADLNAEGPRPSPTRSSRAAARRAQRVDITDVAGVKQMAAEAKATFGGVDILVNNAALMVELGYQAAVDVPIEEWNKLMAVNVTGALNCVQALVPQMRERGGGKIVNQLSGGAFPAQSLYASASWRCSA